MAYIDRGGVKVYYEEHGDGPPILLSHGYSSTARMWDGQIAHFKDRYKVIAWDMRGHGQSDSPDELAEYTEEATADDMAAILKACGASSAIIGGLSLGGYISLAFNIRHPDMVDALMLFDTGPGYRNPQGRAGWNKTAEDRAIALEERGLDALAGDRASRHRSAAGLAKAARGILVQVDGRVIESLDSIKVPTLVLVGAKDQPFLAASDYMAVKIPGAAKVVLDDAGHASNIDQPAAFNEAVESFLTRIKA